MEVYVLEYFPIDLADCNGVFTTYEKAKESFEEDCKRCANIWHNIDIEEAVLEEGKYPYLGACWEVVPKDGSEPFSAMASIYVTEIQ